MMAVGVQLDVQAPAAPVGDLVRGHQMKQPGIGQRVERHVEPVAQPVAQLPAGRAIRGRADGRDDGFRGGLALVVVIQLEASRQGVVQPGQVELPAARAGQQIADGHVVHRLVAHHRLAVQIQRGRQPRAFQHRQHVAVGAGPTVVDGDHAGAVRQRAVAPPGHGLVQAQDGQAEPAQAGHAVGEGVGGHEQIVAVVPVAQPDAVVAQDAQVRPGQMPGQPEAADELDQLQKAGFQPLLHHRRPAAQTTVQRPPFLSQKPPQPSPVKPPVAGEQQVLPHAGVQEAQEEHRHRPQLLCRRGVGMAQLVGHMSHLARPGITAQHAHALVRARCGRGTEEPVGLQLGKVDPRIQVQMQRLPVAGIDLDDVEPIGGRIAPVFDHGAALPAQMPEPGDRIGHQVGTRPRPAQRHGALGVRPAMHVVHAGDGARRAVDHQQAHPGLHAVARRLHQQPVVMLQQGRQPAVRFLRVARVPHAGIGPVAAVAAVGLEEQTPVCRAQTGQRVDGRRGRPVDDQAGGMVVQQPGGRIGSTVSLEHIDLAGRPVDHVGIVRQRQQRG